MRNVEAILHAKRQNTLSVGTVPSLPEQGKCQDDVHDAGDDVDDCVRGKGGHVENGVPAGQGKIVVRRV